jgi:hypothetical protein
VPAAAVIPASVAYIKIVAVKTSVVCTSSEALLHLCMFLIERIAVCSYSLDQNRMFKVDQVFIFSHGIG